ncbi:MAG: hypothetical protein WDZ59_15765 [Pirellulales bacterium]
MAKTKPKQKYTYRASDGGTAREEQCRTDFADCLMVLAVANMKRRGSQTLDESDFDTAYRELLSAKHTDWIRQIGGSVMSIFGAFAFSTSVTLKPTWVWLWAAAGAALILCGLFIQHYPHWKK